MLPHSQDSCSYPSVPLASDIPPAGVLPIGGLHPWSAVAERAQLAYATAGPAPSPLQAERAASVGAAEDRDRLYSDFQPLVRRLIRQYGGEDPELRQDLAGETYFRFCALLEAYDPSRGVPLRPYLVRQLTASVYTFARQQWRNRKREVSLEGRMEDGGEGAMGMVSRGAQWGHAPAPIARGGGSSGASLASLAAAGSLSGVGSLVAREWANDPTPAWDEAIVRDELLRCLPSLISRLPQRQRQVLVWRYYEQRSFEEIAELLQVKVATTRSLLRHGLNALRKGLRVGAPATE